MQTCIVGALAIILALAITGASRADSYDEALNGDLANDGLTPTPLALTLGSNIVRGVTIRGDRDYLTIHVPVGLLFDSLIETEYVSTDDLGFIGLQAGTIVTGTTAQELLGYQLFGATDLGANILPIMATKPLVIGFVAPLPAGDYGVWIQQTGPQQIDYGFDFHVSAVPEPSSGILAASIAALALVARALLRQRQ